MHMNQPYDTTASINIIPRILITGANGFTGRHACTYFADAGYSVYALVRKEGVFQHRNIHIIKGDLMEQSTLIKLCADIEPHFVLHLAGQNAVDASWSRPIATLEANLMGTAYLLDAIRTEAKNCKVLIAGSILQSDPRNADSFTHPYGLSKTLQALYSQVYASLFDLEVVIANPSNLIGPGPSTGVCTVFAKRIAKMEAGCAEKKLSIYNSLAERDFLDVRDAIKAYHLLLLKGKAGTDYPVASGIARTLQEVAAVLHKLATVHFDIEAEIEVQETLPPIQLEALKNFGWSPSIPFEQSLADIFDEQRKKLVK